MLSSNGEYGYNHLMNSPWYSIIQYIIHKAHCAPEDHHFPPWWSPHQNPKQTETESCARTRKSIYYLYWLHEIPIDTLHIAAASAASQYAYTHTYIEFAYMFQQWYNTNLHTFQPATATDLVVVLVLVVLVVVVVASCHENGTSIKHKHQLISARMSIQIFSFSQHKDAKSTKQTSRHRHKHTHTASLVWHSSSVFLSASYNINSATYTNTDPWAECTLCLREGAFCAATMPHSALYKSNPSTLVRASLLNKCKLYATATHNIYVETVQYSG